MIDILTRPLHPNDLPDLHHMIGALAAHHGDVATLSLDALARDTADGTSWLHVLVAEHQSTLVGYAALCPLVQLQFGVRGMDMHHLFVRQHLRGQGIGRALIDASIRTAQDLDCQFMTVGTHPDNSQAGEVYLAAGFEPLPPGPRLRLKFEC